MKRIIVLQPALKLWLASTALITVLALVLSVPAYAVAEWTIMVYMNSVSGGSLDGGAVDDINAMEDAVFDTAKIKVIVQVYRVVNNIPTCKRYKITRETTHSDNITSSEVYDVGGSVDMSNPQTLGDFGKWVIQQPAYQANRYSLIIWGHGSGWYKKGSNEFAKWFAGLSVADGGLVKSLKPMTDQLNRKLDHIGFDCCLMGMWEVMDIIKDYANVANASEELCYKFADYKLLLNNLHAKPTMTAVEWAQNILNVSNTSTLSSIDLTKIGNLTAKVDIFGEKLQSYRSGYGAAISTVLDNCTKFWSGSLFYHIDLYEFADRISYQALVPADLKTAATNARDAVVAAVLGTKNRAGYEYCRGLAIYHCKFDASNYDANYDKLPIAGKTCWDHYLQKKAAHAGLTVTITSPGMGDFAFNTVSVNVKADDIVGIKLVELYVDGVKRFQQYYTGSSNYPFEVSLNSKAIATKIEAKAYDNNDNSNTATILINKGQGADSYYNKMNVGDAVYVKDPLTGNTLPCVLQYVDVNGSGVRYASVSINGNTCMINAGAIQKIPNTGLFIYAATVFTGGTGYRFAELMIAPYQYPSLDIIAPEPGISTNSNIVQVATNYSGKNIPWNGVGSPPVRTSDLKTITYGTSSTANESYVWTLSGSNGPRTLTVKLTDKFNPATMVSKSVTVNYDSLKPFYAYRGPLGESWTGRDWYFITCEDGDPVFYFHYWDAAGTNNHTIHNEYCTNGGYMGHPGAKEEMITLIARSLNFPLSRNVPGGATSVYIVNKNEYLESSVTTPVGVIPYYAIYDRLAFLLGKDRNGKYRVWYGTKPDRSDAVPIPALHLPIPPAPTYSNIQKTSIQINWVNLEGEAGYQLQRSPNNAAPWTTKATLGADVTSYTDATIAAGTSYWYRVIGVAFSPCTNQTGLSSQVTSMSLSGIINGDFEGSGGWPEPFTSDDWSHYSKFEIATDGLFGTSKYGKVIAGTRHYHPHSVIISQSFTVPDDALIFQFQKSGGYSALNGIAITSDNNGLCTFNVSSYRGQSVTFNFGTSITNCCYSSYLDISTVCLDNVTIIGTPPAIAITSPANGASININTPTSITVTATDLAGINRVEFFANDAYIGQSTTSPYRCTWTPTIAKSYTLRAVAYDNCGNSSVVTGYNGVVNGDFEGVGGWPPPFTIDTYNDYSKFEIATDGLFGTGKYGKVIAGTRDYDPHTVSISQTFIVPLDATTLQFRYTGGYVMLNGSTITPDVVNGLSTFDISPYRGQSVTLNFGTSISNCCNTNLNISEMRVDDVVINRATNSDVPTVTVTATGEAGYWKLDAVSGTVAADNSGNDNQGVVNSATWAAGQVGNGLSFDGSNDYATVADAASLRAVKYTVSVWIKPNGVPNETWKGIIGKPGRNYNIWLNSAGYIHHRFHNSSSTNAGAPNTPAGSIVWNAWNHIVITNDGVTAKTYINGIEKASGSAGGNQIADNTALYIGRNLDGASGNYFKGMIDEIRIYNKALSVDEVQALHMQGSLAASWKLDETTGIMAVDVSGNGNTGTLTNMDPATDWVDGKYGKALDFDGSNDYVQAAASPTLNISGNQITLAAWVNCTNTGTAQIYMAKPYNASSHTSPYFSYGLHGLYVSATQYRPRFWLSIGGVVKYIASSTCITPGTWAHIAGVYRGDTMKIYVNGVACGSLAVTGNITSYATPLRLGTNGALTEKFKGKIDEVRIYNSALSAAEITAIKNNTKIGDEAADEYSELELAKPVTPKATKLLSCAPNPFRGQTAINFQLARPAQTTIKVYNVMGQEVKTLVSECLRPGYHAVKWDGKDANGNKVAAGVYLYRMQAGDYSAVKKLTVIR